MNKDITYQCVLCKNEFDKPKKKISFPIKSESVGLLIATILFFLFSPFLGVFCLFLSVLFLLFRFLSAPRKEVCPYCGSENFVKMKNCQ